MIALAFSANIGIGMHFLNLSTEIALSNQIDLITRIVISSPLVLIPLPILLIKIHVLKRLVG